MRAARGIMRAPCKARGSHFDVRPMRIALAWLAFAFILPAHAAPCTARSPEHMTALVELYTSEGCSSCPPAERWLSSLAGTYPIERVVPIALHVEYWDYIGWKDPYAKRAFSQRQRKLSQLQRLALVYTPQVLLQGADFRQWAGNAFDAAVVRINARPARARLSLEIIALSAGGLRLRSNAQLQEGIDGEHAGLYLAAYEDRLQSRVTAGENRGRTLSHDRVVLEWRGPYGFARDARVATEVELGLLPGAAPNRSGVVGFVQDRRTGEVLQALALPACGA
jgi:hypothetical protein